MILICISLVVLFLVWYRFHRQRPVNNVPVTYSTEFTEKSKAGTRLRALKRDMCSTWSSNGYAEFDPYILDNLIRYGDSVDVVSVNTMKKDEFVKRYKDTHTPCIIRDIPTNWPAMKKWSFDYFKERYGKCKFMVSADERYLKYDYFHHYINHKGHRKDDNPLNIFDFTFAEQGKKSRELLDDYEIPEWFSEDWLSCLGEDQRPPFRWLIAGPRRSGSSLHVDPVATGAWNTLIKGKKRWILFPPDTFDILKNSITPESGSEWFIKQYELHKDKKHYDVVQERGETIFVPPNWWHVTMNIEDSIAITQNYICDSNVELCKELFPRKRRKTYLKWLKMMDGKVTDDRNMDDIPYDSDLYNSTDSEDE